MYIYTYIYIYMCVYECLYIYRDSDIDIYGDGYLLQAIASARHCVTIWHTELNMKCKTHSRRKADAKQTQSSNLTPCLAREPTKRRARERRCERCGGAKDVLMRATCWCERRVGGASDVLHVRMIQMPED